MGTHPIFESDFDCLTDMGEETFDLFRKKAAGETLSERDVQRLRNHQIRMMRRQWLHDMTISPREPLFPQNNLLNTNKLGRLYVNTRMSLHALGAQFLLPKDTNWLFPRAASTHMWTRNWTRGLAAVPYAAWKVSVGMGMVAWPLYVVFSFLQDEYPLRRFPTMWNQTGWIFHNHLRKAGSFRIYPDDRCFTTRVGNLDEQSLEAYAPRALDASKLYPLGTRVNWVTWEPVYPENNELENENYGNGPGGIGPMSETCRLIHTTKKGGLWSRQDSH